MPENIWDMIQAICAVIGVIFALIAFVQSKHADEVSQKANENAEKANTLSEKANKHAEEANVLSEKANTLSQKAITESEKKFFPILKFVNGIHVVEKDYITLCNEISFDYIDDLINYDEHYDDKITCICFQLKNIGSGIVSKITMEGIFIQEGNPLTLDERFQGNRDTLFFDDSNHKVQEMMLCPGETVKINLLINNLSSGTVKGRQDEYEKRMEEFLKNNNNVTVGIKLRLSSINKSSYDQDWLFGTFLNGEICLNSIGDAEKDGIIGQKNNTDLRV